MRDRRNSPGSLSTQTAYRQAIDWKHLEGSWRWILGSWDQSGTNWLIQISVLTLVFAMCFELSRKIPWCQTIRRNARAVGSIANAEAIWSDVLGRLNSRPLYHWGLLLESHNRTPTYQSIVVGTVRLSPGLRYLLIQSWFFPLIANRNRKDITDCSYDYYRATEEPSKFRLFANVRAGSQLLPLLA